MVSDLANAWLSLWRIRSGLAFEIHDDNQVLQSGHGLGIAHDACITNQILLTYTDFPDSNTKYILPL